MISTVKGPLQFECTRISPPSGVHKVRSAQCRFLLECFSLIYILYSFTFILFYTAITQCSRFALRSNACILVHRYPVSAANATFTA